MSKQERDFWLIGQTFGLWTAGAVVSDGRRRFSMCQCRCGSPPRYVRLDQLRSGDSKSCGCLQREAVTTHGLWKDPLYTVWRAMHSRCYNAKDKRYSRYGGRGIVVCERWHDVFNFIQDMRPGFVDGQTIDRIDNDGPYCKDNCRWATRRQQARNYSRNIILEHDGRRMCALDWALELGLNPKVVYERIAAGWTHSDALTRPVKR